MSWFAAFCLTALVEMPLVAIVAPSGRRQRAALDSIAANLLTHPVAWLLNVDALLPWVVIELLVAAVETLVYVGVTRLRWSRALAASLLANGVTASLSFVV